MHNRANAYVERALADAAKAVANAPLGRRNNTRRAGTGNRNLNSEEE